eukprot:11268850-Ditylum_brightwellii.AAC.1
MLNLETQAKHMLNLEMQAKHILNLETRATWVMGFVRWRKKLRKASREVAPKIMSLRIMMWSIVTPMMMIAMMVTSRKVQRTSQRADQPQLFRQDSSLSQ